jgi:hypothetical protein
LAKAPQGFEHWQVGFSRSIVFDTLPVPDPQGTVSVYRVKERFHQRGFAQPGLARDEEKLTSAGQGRVKTAL